MDLHLVDAEPTAAERAAVDALLGPPRVRLDGRRRGEPSTTARRGRRPRGARPAAPAAAGAAGGAGARRAGSARARSTTSASGSTVPPADAYGVATFYALLATEPRPPRVVHVCDDLACKCVGADELIAQLEERFGPEGDLPTTAPPLVRSPCLGQCDRAPAALLTVAGRRARRDERVAGAGHGPRRAARRWPARTSPGDPRRRALAADRRPRCACCARVGRVDPVSLDDYRAAGGYDALRRAVALGPDGVIREVKDSKLMGRGGAAFPTGVKWEAVARQPARPHYLICNADESEPGTFKDRVLIEGDPFALIEAMTIAGYATGCEQRLRLPARRVPAGARASLAHAIDEARARAASSATTCWARASPSTSRSAGAPAPTSAARRRRSSTRSRATAASRATSRRSRS